MNEPNYPQSTNTEMLPSSSLATISLVAGILGFVALPIVASIVAIWTGYAARQETRSVPPQASGDGFATAGIIMGWIQIGLSVVGICCFALYFLFIFGMVSTGQ